MIYSKNKGSNQKITLNFKLFFYLEYIKIILLEIFFFFAISCFLKNTSFFFLCFSKSTEMAQIDIEHAIIIKPLPPHPDFCYNMQQQTN